MELLPIVEPDLLDRTLSMGFEGLTQPGFVVSDDGLIFISQGVPMIDIAHLSLRAGWLVAVAVLLLLGVWTLKRAWGLRGLALPRSEPVCPLCGYSHAGGPHPACPECGCARPPVAINHWRRQRLGHGNSGIVLRVGLALVGSVCALLSEVAPAAAPQYWVVRPRWMYDWASKYVRDPERHLRQEPGIVVFDITRPAWRRVVLTPGYRLVPSRLDAAGRTVCCYCIDDAYAAPRPKLKEISMAPALVDPHTIHASPSKTITVHLDAGKDIAIIAVVPEFRASLTDASSPRDRCRYAMSDDLSTLRRVDAKTRETGAALTAPLGRFRRPVHVASDGDTVYATSLGDSRKPSNPKLPTAAVVEGSLTAGRWRRFLRLPDDTDYAYFPFISSSPSGRFVAIVTFTEGNGMGRAVAGFDLEPSAGTDP